MIGPFHYDSTHEIFLFVFLVDTTAVNIFSGHEEEEEEEKGTVKITVPFLKLTIIVYYIEYYGFSRL